MMHDDMLDYPKQTSRSEAWLWLVDIPHGLFPERSFSDPLVVDWRGRDGDTPTTLCWCTGYEHVHGHYTCRHYRRP